MHIPAAGAVVFDATHRILLVKRGRHPAAGRWSVPGGKCLPDEAPADCCVREVAEETGLAVQVVRPAGRVELPAPDGATFVIDDFVCSVRSAPMPGLVPGDDAAAAGWFTQADLLTLELVDGLWDALACWGLLPD